MMGNSPHRSILPIRFGVTSGLYRHLMKNIANLFARTRLAAIKWSTPADGSDPTKPILLSERY